MENHTLPLTGLDAIDRVDPRIFTLKFFGACMQCTFCHDGCCQYGCDVNVGERDRILALADDIAPYVAVPKGRWFGTQVHVDPEYPTGQFVRANAEDGRCVFRNPKGRGCALHQFALDTGRDYHQVKPMVCWLFPICWDQRVLRPNSDVDDDLVCRGSGMTLYQAARDELRIVFGDRLIEQLDRYAQTTASVPAAAPSAAP